jgi:hypothetical protein
MFHKIIRTGKEGAVVIVAKSKLIELVPQRYSCRRLVFIFSLILLAGSLRTISSCEKEATSSASQSSRNERGICGPIQSSPIAHQPLALARYRILMQIQRQYGDYKLPGKTLFTRDDVLFPAGRSDKAYAIAQRHKAKGRALVELACYESSGKDVRLVYSVKMRIIYKPPKDKIRVRNVLDYISLLGYNSEDPQEKSYSYAVPGNISKNVKRDLSLAQELVDYSFESNIGILYVQFFRSKVAQSIDEHERMQSFFVPDDSTDNPTASSQWYKTYGLPVANCELTAQGG